MKVTGEVAKFAGDFGLPCGGLIGSALSFGATLLLPNQDEIDAQRHDETTKSLNALKLDMSSMRKELENELQSGMGSMRNELQSGNNMTI